MAAATYGSSDVIPPWRKPPSGSRRAQARGIAHQPGVAAAVEIRSRPGFRCLLHQRAINARPAPGRPGSYGGRREDCGQFVSECVEVHSGKGERVLAQAEDAEGVRCRKVLPHHASGLDHL